MPLHRPLCVLVVILAAIAEATLASNATSGTGFLDCLSAARGRSSRVALLNADDEQRDAFLGRVMGCARLPVVRGLRAVRDGGDLRLWDGAVVLHHRTTDTAEGGAVPMRTASSRALGEDRDGDDLVATHDLIVELDRVSRSYVMDVELYPGVKASLQRDARSEDAVNLSFKLDQRSVQDDDDEVEEEDEDEEEGRDILEDYGIIEDRHGHKKKKVLKGLKKLKKKLKPYLPLLAIPIAIQLMMLPLYIMALKMMALKSILLGKMTLMLVAFNILRNAQQRQFEDDHNSRVAAEYYGYNEDGLEYGGWVNRRRGFSGRSADDGQRSQRSLRRR